MWISRAELRRLLAQRDELKEKIASLEVELREERERSRRREDELLDRVLTASGRHGLTPEAKLPAEPKVRPPVPMTALDEARRDAYRKAAVEAGRTVQEADQFFDAQRNGKQYPLGLPDEPYVIPT